ncbi:hypothetical protein JW756_05575 [Candidatus Woesearchaeota archaeon]|nr:hypothetical protein [Candidatus Woesearchaeota archaeon]
MSESTNAIKGDLIIFNLTLLIQRECGKMDIVNKESQNILIPITSMGGYGDIIAGVAFHEYFDSIGISHKIYAPNDLIKSQFNQVLGRSKSTQLPAFNDGLNSEFVSVCPVSDSRSAEQKAKTRNSVIVTEYDRDRYTTWSNYSNNIITISTGFGFKPAVEDVQAGVYVRKNLEFMLKTIEDAVNSGGDTKPLRKRVLAETWHQYKMNKWMKAFIGANEQDLLNSRWSLAYSSSLASYWNFFDIIDAAKSKLDKPLFIFSTAPEGDQKEVSKKAERLDFQYHNLCERESRRTPSPITVIELGGVSDNIFRSILALTDTLSLVTGDHSLSQAIQKSQTRCAVPFLYHMASWKDALAHNFYSLLKKSSQEAASLFGGYISTENTGKGYKIMECRDLKANPEELAKLVYDKQVIADYNKAVASVRDNFIRERQDAGIRNAELLWSITDSVGFIIRGLLNGKDSYEAVKSLLPEKVEVKIKEEKRVKRAAETK